ncbi:MAG: hypothetical protein ACE5RH_01515, partial [Nitrosarchaeum sp.]
MSIIDDAVEELNLKYSSWVNPNDQLCYSGTDFVPDSRIQFVANKIFIQDSYGWNNDNDYSYKKCPGDSNWYLSYLDNQINNDFTIPRGINIYFTEDSATYNKYWIQQPTDTLNFDGAEYACSKFPSFSNYTSTSRIHMPDCYSKYWWMKNIVPQIGRYGYPQWDSVVRNWEVKTIAFELAHEIGHSFNLYHPKSFRSQIHLYYPSKYCSSTLMCDSGVSSRDYLPPTEIGRIYGAAVLSNIRSFIPNDNYLGVKVIGESEQWYNMRLYYSLNILGNVELTLPCEITMPYQSWIDVSGKLIIDNSNIHSITNEWNGITVKSQGLLIINSTTISDYNIIVESGGTIIISGDLNLIGEHQIEIKSGGYICFDSNTSLNLNDVSSNIIIREGANYGTHPALYLQNNCISSP